MVHRDIKPSNIKLTPRGIVKLVDFGLVKLLQDDESRTVTVVQGRGTEAYTPLEQYGGDTGHTDVRSDIYAFGATLYSLLTGQTPADAKQRFLKPGSLVPPRDINSRISPHTERVMMMAMAQHPDDRPSSVEELRQILFTREAPSLTSLRGLPLGSVPRVAWGEALRSNPALLAATLVLTLMAFVVSLWSPLLPGR